jgi:23S rRNA (cytidine2498-2'-O)-methyltransferase
MNPQQLCIIANEFKSQLDGELAFLQSIKAFETPSTIGLVDDAIEPAWAQSVWRNVKGLEFDSIGDAQKKLRAISKTWRYYADQFNRRGTLITAGLDLAKESRPYRFPARGEKNPPPVFTLGTNNLIYYSQKIQRPNHDGKISFVENKTAPPSRAYLKLWEALTVLGDWPRQSDTVLDLGSSPGSWTWALAELGAAVTSVDRSPLAETLHKYPNILFKSGDAFSIAPKAMDWVFSDVICFPEKLYEYLQSWLQSGHCKKFVCSVKFAGGPSHELIDRFRKLPNSRILHLYHNKNEVTWIHHPKLETASLRMK